MPPPRPKKPPPDPPDYLLRDYIESGLASDKLAKNRPKNIDRLAKALSHMNRVMAQIIRGKGPKS